MHIFDPKVFFYPASDRAIGYASFVNVLAFMYPHFIPLYIFASSFIRYGVGLGLIQQRLCYTPRKPCLLRCRLICPSSFEVRVLNKVAQSMLVTLS